ncbi:MAG: dihydroorotate dehydrogenase [Verrucomicrobia bacterium]|nr:dihydroorotate dehydrogenase [Verrucomicrobiota bacterium]
MKHLPPRWHPDHPAIYDIGKSYAVNAAEGPFFQGQIPKRPHPNRWIDFLGFKVRSPIGVPAGPLLNSRWISLAGKLGYDLPVYKTIRSFAHPGHALPNMVYVETDGPRAAHQIGEPPSDLSHLTVTNSFGMPSKSPDFLLEDIGRAQESLGEGQLLIVSVVGTPNHGVSFAEDFVRAAMIAKEAGAKVIEANFSCPNVGKAEGCLYMSPESVGVFASALVKAIRPVPLILKVGLFDNPEQMKQVFLAAARAGARAVCGINSVSMQVQPPLGEGRASSGVCGAAIRPQAVQFIKEAVELNQRERLGLTLMGCGGIVEPGHFDEFLTAGATIAMVATGMMWDPYLALRWHGSHP